MEVLKYPCKLQRPTAVALGQFDAVHCAHAKVIGAASKMKQSGLAPCVFTFSDNPGKVHTDVLVTEEEKLELFKNLSVEVVVSTEFDLIRHYSAEEFVRKVLVESLGAKAVFCGFNYRFGKGAAGDVQTLTNLCAQYGVSVCCVDEVDVDDMVVSSTAIRNHLSDGRLETANRMLGREYSLCGRVVHGNGIGRTISTPTLNVDVPREKLLPKFGVYVCEALVDAVSYRAVCNIGCKPTVGSDFPTVEVYLLDAKGDFYGDFACVKLLEFVREERRFEDMAELRKQIAQDVAFTNEFFAKK